jgi:hypothetical protein
MGFLSQFDRSAPASADAPSMPDTGDAQALLPVLRSRSAVAGDALSAAIFGTDTPGGLTVETVGGDLGVVLIDDRPGVASFIDSERLNQFGLEPSEALELALANLRRRSEPKFSERGAGVFVSGWGDGQDASRLLLPDLFAALPVKGDPVAMAPTAGTLLVTGADDNDGLRAMAAAAAATLSTTEQPLSAHALRLRDGKWTDFAPDPAEFAALDDLRRGQAMREYAEQQGLLHQLMTQRGDDVLIANCTPMQDRRTGRPFCMTFWVDGFASLLPRVDVLAFKNAAELMLVPWDAAASILGGRMTATDHYPIRYRVEAFPSDAERERLRAAATLVKPTKTK